MSEYLVCGQDHLKNYNYYLLFVAENSFAFGAINTLRTIRTHYISTQLRGRRCHGSGYSCCCRDCRPDLENKILTSFHNLT